MMANQDEWFDMVCESYINPPVLFRGEILPGFPPDQVQKNTTGQVGINTLREAHIFFQDCVEVFSGLGAPINEDKKLLDFGVGWGRIARFFMREIPLSNIYGLDVMDSFIEICKETFKSNNFYVTDPFPPSIFDNQSFDFIVGYSVFSHLSEKACMEWMMEFYRITTPGAIIALTTRGRPFFDYCESRKNKGLEGYANALGGIFTNFDEARARYDKGEFVHSNTDGVAGGGAMTADYYGETFIPEQYARETYKNNFTLEKFLFNPSRQSHPILFFRRK